MKPTLALAALLFVSAGAMAQDASRPLNLKLPPDYVPASSATTPSPAHAGTTAAQGGNESVAVTPSRPKDPPGTYYGDTSGRMADAVVDDEPRCDDATYNKPQVHGSVSTGVMSGSHGRSGDFQSGAVNLSQAFGSCDHPTGGVSISIGGGTGHFDPGHR